MLSDIRFWIIFFFLLRLIGITNPPLEVGHNWRQTDTAMVARNFLEMEPTIMYPRVDTAGEKTGITGMEFPVFNYLIYLVSLIFGYDHWYGRLINLIVTSFGLWFFFRLASRFFNAKVALYATLILTCSVWFQFSRKIMPDTFSMSLVITGIFFALEYFTSSSSGQRMRYIILFFLLFTLGTLSKISSGYLLVMCIPALVSTSPYIWRKIWFCLLSVISIAIILFWYYMWTPYLVETYGYWHFFMGKSFSQGLSELGEHLPNVLSKFYDTALKFIGFGVFLAGVILAIIKKDKVALYVFISSSLAFGLVVIKTGFNFSHHNYYVIPYVPIMALMAGFALSLLKSQRWAIVIVALVCLESTINQNQDFRIKKENAFLTQLDQLLDEHLEKDGLVLINSNQHPTPMYFAHRKGWVASNENILANQYIDSLSVLGLKYVLILKHGFGEDIQVPELEILVEDEHLRIYKL